MKNIILTLLLSISFISNAQVGIGTTSPNASSVLELQATEGGLLVPRMTKSQREAIAPANASTFTANPEKSTKGLLVYQIDNAEGFYYFDGANWKALGGAAATDTDWTIVGDDMYNANPGNVGVGIDAPSTQFHINGTTVIGDPGGTVAKDIINEGFESGIGSFTNASSNNTDWLIDSSEFNNGLNSASVGSIGVNKISSLTYSITVSPTANNPLLSFFFKTSTENRYDFLKFFVDNGDGNGLIEMTNFNTSNNGSGETPWTEYTYSLVPGVSYVFQWTYDTDGSGSDGADMVWIDDVIITEEVNELPTLASYVLRIEDNLKQDGYVLMSDADGNAYWDDVSNGTLEGVQNLSISGTDLSITDANTVDLSTISTDDQKIDLFSFASNTLNVSLEDDDVANETLDLSALIGSDNQTIDEFSLTNNILSLSIKNDGEVPKTIDLSSLNNSGTDAQNIDEFSFVGNDLNVSLFNDNVPNETVSLASLVGSDDQKIDKFDLSGNIIKLSLEDDGQVDKEIDLSFYNNSGTDIQNIDEFSLTGNILSLSLQNDGDAPKTVNLSPLLISLYTFENALKILTNDVKLGGALTKNTTLSSTNDNFILQGNTRNIFEVNPYKDFIMFGGATPVPYSTSSYPAPSDGDTMTDSGGADYTVKIVAGFYSSETVDGSTTDDDGGTAISLGDSEYIVDGFNEILLNGSFSSLENDSFGRSDKRWVEVFSKNGLNNTSDMNLKTNITELNRGLKEILALRTISYQWKDEKKGGKQIPENLQQRKIGFSAQQLQTIIPEVVHTHSWIPADEKGNYKYKKNKNLGVYYSDMIPVQVKAIQEQQEEIKELELLISNLENTLNSLKNK